LILTFGILRLSKAELIAAAENPDMVDALEAYCEAVRETRESLKAALHFLESANVRIIVGMAAAQFRNRHSA